jgi:peptide/nickel transport system ATP-binding protein
MSMEGAETTTPKNILTINNLKVTFHTYAGDVKALDGVELSVRKGELFGLVGESGCGKSVTTLAIVGLLPPNAEIISGEILLDGATLLNLKKDDLRLTRLRDVAIVFQDPMTYLNPVLTVGMQIVEIIASQPELFVQEITKSRLAEIAAIENSGIEINDKLRKEKEKLQTASLTCRLGKNDLKRLARQYAISILESVRRPEPAKVFKMYPFELSGGMRQRAMIAMALVRRPKLLLADEITTALDVTVQAQVLQLLQQLKMTIDTSVLLITHDLAIVAEVCDRIAVMYAGNIVEVADVNELFKNPLHPYTQGLLASVPRPDVAGEQKSIQGSVPDLIFPPSGCRFHPRCPKAFEECPASKPTLIEVTPEHFVSCFLYKSEK